MPSAASPLGRLLDVLPGTLPLPQTHAARQAILVAPALIAICLGYQLAELSWELFLQSPTSSSSKRLEAPSVETVEKHAKAERHALIYTPSSIPGGRLVETPYGKMQVYEAGPEDGRRVVFVHGLSTPCLSLANVAGRLVNQGCRVILFDFFGRGFSDAPTSIPYDNCLYNTQVLLALSSSPVSWPNFTLVGYSLGGGLVADFASYFPHLVTSLVLIAPGGIMRPSYIGWTSKLMYSDWMQKRFPSLVDRYVRSRLYSDVEKAAAAANAPESTTVEGTEVSAETTGGTSQGEQTKRYDNPWIEWTPLAANQAVNLSLKLHPGFSKAIVSSVRHAPIVGQQDRWKLVKCPTLLLLGARDPIVRPDDLQEDAKPLLGDRLKVRIIDTNHNIPMTNGEDCARAIVEMWQEEEKENEVEAVEVSGVLV